MLPIDTGTHDGIINNKLMIVVFLCCSIGFVYGLFLVKQKIIPRKSKHVLGPKGRATIIAHRGSRNEGAQVHKLQEKSLINEFYFNIVTTHH